MPTSATGATVVITGGAQLLVVLGFPVGELTFAMLVNEPFAGVVTTTVRLLIWPLARAPRVLFTTDLSSAELSLLPINVALASKVSVTTTLLAMEGPKLVTEIV